MNYIDLHTHGIAGKDSHSKDPAAYIEMADAYSSHGTSAFLVTLFPCPLTEMRAQMAAVKKAMEVQGPGPQSEIRSPKSATILGVHLEGPFVNPARCGALDSASFMGATRDNIAMLLDGFHDVVRIITVAPELPGALSVIEAASGMGIRVNMGHSAATFSEAAEGRRAGATGVTHLFNAMSPIHHREPGLAGFALTDDSMYVEIIADFVHVHKEIVRLALKCKPAGRVLLVSDSLGAAKTPAAPSKGPLYMPDGATLAGSGISLADAVANLVSLGIPEDESKRFAIDNPAAYLGLTQEIL